MDILYTCTENSDNEMTLGVFRVETLHLYLTAVVQISRKCVKRESGLVFIAAFQ